MIFPMEVLTKLSRFLKHDGKFLINIPNYRIPLLNIIC